MFQPLSLAEIEKGFEELKEELKRFEESGPSQQRHSFFIWVVHLQAFLQQITVLQNPYTNLINRLFEEDKDNIHDITRIFSAMHKDFLDGKVKTLNKEDFESVAFPQKGIGGHR